MAQRIARASLGPLRRAERGQSSPRCWCRSPNEVANHLTSELERARDEGP
jgi:hypothetical protein